MAPAPIDRAISPASAVSVRIESGGRETNPFSSLCRLPRIGGGGGCIPGVHGASVNYGSGAPEPASAIWRGGAQTRACGVPGFTVVMAAGGGEHTLVTTHDGALWACGPGFYGQLDLVQEKDSSDFE